MLLVPWNKSLSRIANYQNESNIYFASQSKIAQSKQISILKGALKQGPFTCSTFNAFNLMYLHIIHSQRCMSPVSPIFHTVSYNHSSDLFCTCTYLKWLTVGSLVDLRAYKPYTLVGPPVWWPVLAPLAVYSSTTVYTWWCEHTSLRCMIFNPASPPHVLCRLNFAVKFFLIKEI